ncbi:MAG: twin-arginine translocase subunit TatB [Gammaproteobacteria bacterium]|nr:twin-arginine translocase subunit TatB [Gammaproteobacteria bacterium]
MFEIGFWELVLVGIVALLAVGPERLPELAYNAGRSWRKLQRMISNVRFNIENELHEHELHQLLKSQEQEIEQLRSLMQDTASAVHQHMTSLPKTMEPDIAQLIAPIVPAAVVTVVTGSTSESTSAEKTHEPKS